MADLDAAAAAAAKARAPLNDLSNKAAMSSGYDKVRRSQLLGAACSLCSSVLPAASALRQCLHASCMRSQHAQGAPRPLSRAAPVGRFFAHSSLPLPCRAPGPAWLQHRG